MIPYALYTKAYASHDPGHETSAETHATTPFTAKPALCRKENSRRCAKRARGTSTSRGEENAARLFSRREAPHLVTRRYCLHSGPTQGRRILERPTRSSESTMGSCSMAARRRTGVLKEIRRVRCRLRCYRICGLRHNLPKSSRAVPGPTLLATQLARGFVPACGRRACRSVGQRPSAYEFLVQR